ncbi:methionine adenosyltransferase [Haloferax volcanii]|uniref:S-adenosylmethionine synthase n=5 Tax=Haloferax volcanii TaxID=2246 RepID=D4GZ77_HALVD|nr:MULTISPECIES: methionine adenosyltransferase [Haloferax]ADE03125.1 S-adenosylmethionine synthase [Haloferax volcanii DS2]ELK51278.1 S-adenosylmethionine synthetase [Haloferax sp. BAB-2207]ELY35663.1 S-adenosylmethionine synthetase [Haloferax volcanii DS2]ELZ74447.1 S-adenosylmethionine synthetase [Haloferax lucentense DSM 14919]ELZ93725.1 S-adenosylmethionine synthetase [Haloferax alexandrinus JCM 10717]
MSDRNIRLESADKRAVEDQEVEIVERKGIGHPDSISDGIAESVSRALSNLYLDRVGKVLHYNTDETQLVAGTAAPAFGGGEVIEPIYLLIVGRATKEYDGEKIPVDSTALRAAREYLNENIPGLDVGTDIIVDVKLGEGSGDLQDVFGEETQQVPMANDTSFGVGHAPLTETERIVLEAERALNGPAYGDDHPELGQDIKLMGKREGDVIDVTVAAAMVDKHLDDIDDYVAAVDDVREFVSDLATDYTDREVNVEVNTADDYDEGSIYLTTTGTSAEQGDDGSVGRGNRANGLITPNRPMSMEATSGKNPVNHIGKIYNLLSTHIAETVVDEVDGIRDLQVRLLSQIGRPIDEPHVADAKVITDDGVTIADIEDEVIAIIDRELANVTDITRRTIEGELSTF